MKPKTATERWVDRWAPIATMPHPATVIAVALVFFVGTGVRVLASTAWSPPGDWLTFLGVALGLGVVQYAAKRQTDGTYAVKRAKAAKAAR
jgi:protein-S-isoprenylcysteine O-methyltransferase Ste14